MFGFIEEHNWKAKPVVGHTFFRTERPVQWKGEGGAYLHKKIIGGVYREMVQCYFKYLPMMCSH